jgi:fermentation-respiration switch protein FrsA (DUF1100 family)
LKRGSQPVDEGVFGHCRIYKAGEVKDGMALVVAGRRSKPIAEDERPFELTVVGKGETVEIGLKTTDHRISLAVARAARTAEPRGLVLYLSSIMLISKEERAFIKTLQKRGWNVAAITPSVDLFAKDRWELAWGEEQLDKQASIVAAEIDNYLAETAYAAEAVLAYLRRNNPKWVAGPRVVIGASAGTLPVPALIRRIGGADAAIFIGGGANVAEVVLESSLDIYRPEIALTNEDSMAPSRRRAGRMNVRTSLKKLVLQRSRLDPLHLAPDLQPTPTLMLSGELDRIVPAHTGDLLYEARGRPERWRFPVGHVLLFLGLPLQGDRVADWMDAAVARKN